MFFSWIIFGPTASGKSARAFALAREKGADILSFDSRQVYNGMAIATGQDIPEGYSQQADGSFFAADDKPRLFGFNIIEPHQPFSVHHYSEYARPIIEKHREQEKPLLLVGGSWPYAQVLIDPPQSLHAAVDYQLRSELSKKSVAELQERLKVLDGERWNSMNTSDQQNPRRLIRAIEAAKMSTEPPTPLLSGEEYTLMLHFLPVVQLEENIKKRIEQRLQQGVLEETRSLMVRYKDWNTPAFSATGYQYLRQHLEGKISLDEAKQLWYFQERQYAKRQLTWLKRLSSEKRYNIHQ